MVSKHVKLNTGEKDNVTFTESRFQANLQYIETQFQEAFANFRLRKNKILFIDGIDIRPHSIPYNDYLECIKGLANAAWSLNNDFFPSLRDQKGRCKIVILIRPDIFAALGLQNQNTKIRDNSVLLDWRTSYQFYRNSELFKIAERLLSHQQNRIHTNSEYWDQYFPYHILNTVTGEETDSSFIAFLRFSFWRPRDIVTMLKTLRENFIEQGRPAKDIFHQKDFDSPIFRRKYADYLLGEIKDHLSFYYTESEYEIFLKFFEYLNGAMVFEYDFYVNSFSAFENYLKKNNINPPEFASSPDIFLQFIYELNVVSYTEIQEGKKIKRWCFRQRTYSNISPKIKTDLKYEIHYGLSKALNLGSRISRKSR